MRIHRVLVFSAIVILSACASSQPTNNFELTVADDGIEMQLSRDMLIGILEDRLDTTIDCGDGANGELRDLLAPLATRRYATNTVIDDGDRITAVRRGSKLRLTTGEGSAGRLEATLPWSFGECLLGRDITVADALGSKPITITYTTDEGKVMRASVR